MKKLLFTLLITLAVMRVLACTCPGPYEFDFYKNVSNDHLIGAFVFHSVGTKDFPPPSGAQHVFANVILLEPFKNIDAEVGDTLTLIMEDGVNCAESASKFKKDDTLILAISINYWYYGTQYLQDTFYLDGCGAHFLRITNGQHEGFSVPEIKEKILGLLLPIQDWVSHLGLEVFPNPVYESLTIKAPAGKILRVDLMDVQGRWLFKKEDVQEVMELDLSGILPGLYLLRVETDLGVEVRKLIRY